MACFLVDENLPHSLIRELEKLGHKASHVCNVGLAGRSDEDVLAYAKAHGPAVITCDKGLGNQKRFPSGATGEYSSRGSQTSSSSERKKSSSSKPSHRCLPRRLTGALSS